MSSAGDRPSPALISPSETVSAVPVVKLNGKNFIRKNIAGIFKRVFKILEVPVIMNERMGGVSSINLKNSVYYMIKVTLSIIIARFRK